MGEWLNLPWVWLAFGMGLPQWLAVTTGAMLCHSGERRIPPRRCGMNVADVARGEDFGYVLIASSLVQNACCTSFSL